MIPLKSLIEYLLFLTLSALFFLMPRRWCLALGGTLGRLAFLFAGRFRRIALRNIETALGKEIPPAQRLRLARNSFIHFGRVVADILKIRHLGEKKREKLILVEGRENFVRALEEGRGVLLFTAHYGNWEVAIIPISPLARLWAIARELDNSFLEKELLALRRGLGTNVIYKNQAARRVLQLLRSNDVVAILIDQNVLRIQAVFVDFFGKPAGTTPSLAAFHLKTRAPLVPMFCEPRPDSSYVLKFLPPVQVETEGDYQRDVLKITQTCTKIVEHQIRKAPDAWLWFHDRWKSRPEEEERSHEKRSTGGGEGSPD